MFRSWPSFTVLIWRGLPSRLSRNVRSSRLILVQSTKLKSRGSAFPSRCENSIHSSTSVSRKKNSTRASKWNGPTAATLAAETGYMKDVLQAGQQARCPTRIERIPRTPDGATTVPSFEDHVDYA